MESDTNSADRRPVVEVEFELESGEYPFVKASGTEHCLFDLVEMVPREDGRHSEFFEIRGASPGRILDLADAQETVTPHLLRENETGGLVEFIVSGDCPAVSLAESGALPREVRSRHGEGRIRAEIPARYDASEVIETFLDETPEADLTVKREKDDITPLFARDGFEDVLATRLTDRQREVIEAAFDAGYYDWPRKSTGADVAEELGITSATFSQHIHAAERAILATLFGRGS